MLTLTLLHKIAVWAIPVLLAVTVHEAAHAWVANRCGDNTAKMLGRLSVNPLRHIDLIGTLLVPILIGTLTQFQFVFGWAKPVPINWRNLRQPKRDSGIVAIAGPTSNFIMAFLWALCLKISTILDPETSSAVLFLFLTAQAGILINLILAFLNLIPIPPLDGSRVVTSLVPKKYAASYIKIEPYGFYIIIILLLTGVLSQFLSPLLNWSIRLIYTLLKL